MIPVSQELARRFDQPKWRYANSGTEATLAAFNLMRVVKGRKKIIKIEGSYHGHHDSLFISAFVDLDVIGSEEEPASVPATGGLPTIERPVTDTTEPGAQLVPED